MWRQIHYVLYIISISNSIKTTRIKCLSFYNVLSAELIDSKRHDQSIGMMNLVLYVLNSFIQLSCAI